MKRIYLLFFLSFSIICDMKAQTLLNRGFESWTPSGSPPPFDWEEPTNWKSNNAATEFISATVKKSTAKYSGVYACEIKSLSIFGTDRYGILANGNPAVDMSGYTLNLKNAGTPYTAKPAKLTGYYTYSNTTASDAGYVFCMLKKFNMSTGEADTIAFGSASLTAATTYTAFTVNLTYKSTAAPDSAVVVFYSSNPSSPHNGSVLTVDSVSFISATGIKEEGTNELTVNVFPNPVKSKLLNINFGQQVAGNMVLELYNLAGIKVWTIDGLKKENNIKVDVAPGMYLYRVKDEAGEPVQNGRLIIE